MTRPQWMATIIVTALLGAGWTWLSRAPEGFDQIASPVAGRPAPDFTLSAIDGRTYMLSRLRGQVVILNFWATWCPPCKAEMPALQQAYDAHRDQGLIVLALDEGETPAQVAAFGQELALTFPLLLDPNYAVGDAYRVNAYPATFFVDRRGVIREVVYGGPMTRAFIERKIQSLLETP